MFIMFYLYVPLSLAYLILNLIKFRNREVWLLLMFTDTFMNIYKGVVGLKLKVRGRLSFTSKLGVVRMIHNEVVLFAS